MLKQLELSIIGGRWCVLKREQDQAQIHAVPQWKDTWASQLCYLSLN